jgi:cyclophilin family peptidyl-prolyl cis-trans isomerase
MFWFQPLAAQVVRFETTLGDFDMVLNPTNNPVLDFHTENLLQYVEDERYKGAWINRASTGFVLQMGGFYSHSVRPPLTVESVRSVVAFDPVIGAPGLPGLSNTVGTVSLALPGSNVDGGTSSFFINLGSNTGLNQQFTVFAAIPDMTIVNQIMSLMQVDRTTDPIFGAGPGNLAFNDIPITDAGRVVFIERAFVLEDAMSIAAAMSAVAPIMVQSAAAGGGPAVSGLNEVPEPASFVLFLGSLVALLTARRR